MFISKTVSRQSGIGMVELIMFIVIISIAVAGIMLAMSQSVGHSADPMIRKQAQAVANSLLEEIEAQSAVGTIPCLPVAPPNSGRTGFNTVCSFNGYYTTGGMLDMAGSAVPGLENYNVASTVVAGLPAWNGIPANKSVSITVYVTDPAGKTYSATGYRTAY